MTIACEFLVSGVTHGVRGIYYAIGRCGDLPFRVKDVFDRIEHPKDSPRPAPLRVLRIEAYQRSLEELGAGMTARIDVEGEGIDYLRPNAILIASGISADASATAISQAANDE